MFSPLRNRFGIPGVISVIALVFAMFGGAYAATNNGGGKATASAKAKKGPRGPKGPKGDTGPAGPQGPAGPAGAKGDKGDTGAQGIEGDEGPQGLPGKNGTFSTEPLPSGETLTGIWSSEELFTGGGDGEDRAFVTISYPIQVDPVPIMVLPAQATDLALLLNPSNGEVVDFAGSLFPGKPPVSDFCPGTVAKPEAEPGYLCVYDEKTGVNLDTNAMGSEPSLSTSPYPNGGAKFQVVADGGVGEGRTGIGTWAVTAP